MEIDSTIFQAIDSTIFQDLESFGKGKFFRMAMESFGFFLGKL